jgi:hypothetical protein
MIAPGKAILAEVVANAEDQRLIDLGFQRQGAATMMPGCGSPLMNSTTARASSNCGNWQHSVPRESSTKDPPSKTSSSCPPARLA